MLLVRLMLLLESRDQDRFCVDALPSQPRNIEWSAKEGKGGKPIERCVISSFEVAKSPGLTSEVSPTGAPPLGNYSARLDWTISQGNASEAACVSRFFGKRRKWF